MPQAARLLRLRLGLGGFGLGRFCFDGFGFADGRGLGGRRRGSNEVHPFEDGALGGVALALVHLDDAGVAAVAVFEGGGDVCEEGFGGVFLAQTGGGQTAGVEGAFLAKGDEFLGDGPRGLGLGEGGGDAFVLDEAANEVGEHRVAMLAGAAQLGRSLQVSHSFPYSAGGVSFGGSSRPGSMVMPSVRPSAWSLSLISLRDFLPKLRYLSISDSVFIANWPTVVMLALLSQLAARTDSSLSLTLMLRSFFILFFSSSCLSTTSSNSTAFLS